MLTHLNIRQFALAEATDLELHQGMTVLTGETGAGKSILLDAIGLILGNRADADQVRHGSEKAEISAAFDIKQLASAQQWLEQEDLFEADNHECLIRRVVTKDGRSRAFINGVSATLSQLKNLGQHLVALHSQHEHQALLQKETHRQLLDDFGQHALLLSHVAQCWKTWKSLHRALSDQQKTLNDMQSKREVLSQCVEELSALDPQAGELESLEAEQTRLASAEQQQQVCYQAANACTGDDYSVEQQLHRIRQWLSALPQNAAHNPATALSSADNLLNEAQILVQEAQRELELHIEQCDIQPEQLRTVEERLSAWLEMARKYRISPPELPTFYQSQQSELQTMDDQPQQFEALIEAEGQAKSDLLAACQALKTQREATADGLSKAVQTELTRLNLGHATFAIACEPSELSANGSETVEFLISTQPNTPPKSIAKIASGGELSRISLAIQVVTAQHTQTPTLIFDEVDVGIGGETANTVGHLLRNLGKNGQVLCVTHLGQVAAKAHHHLHIEKNVTHEAVHSHLRPLTDTEKVQEVARMLSGKETEQSLAHAQSLLNV